MVHQVQNGQFTGPVTDPSGAALPTAKITIKNVATGVTTTVNANNTGSYSSPSLPVGDYNVTAEASGFKTSTRPALTLNAGTVARADFQLQVGAVSEVVEVTGAVPVVQTEDSRLGYTVSGQLVSNLPLNGRNVYDLIQLPPGAVNVEGVLTENGHNTVVNGLRENFNGFLINGSSNKGLSGGPVNTPMEDTVQEFQLLTLKNSAEYGNSAGALTNLVQKSGTNSIHGSVFEY